MSDHGPRRLMSYSRSFLTKARRPAKVTTGFDRHCFVFFVPSRLRDAQAFKISYDADARNAVSVLQR
jgi:hypothetical protein